MCCKRLSPAFLAAGFILLFTAGVSAVEITGKSYASYLHYIQGLAYEKRDEINKAIYELEKTIEIDKNAYAAYKELILLYAQAGRLQDANDLASRLARLAGDENTRLFLGSYYVITGDTDSAVAQYEAVYAEHTDNLEALSVLAGIYSVTDPEKALKFLDKYIEFKPDSSDAHYRKAMTLVKLNRLDDAAKILLGAIEAAPSDSLLHVTLAELYEQQKEYIKAAGEMEKAAQINPDNPTLPITAGSYYFFAKELDKAEKVFKQILKSTPNEPTALYWLSLISEERKDWEMALYYMNFIKDDKEYPDPGKYLRMSYYYSQLNEKKTAVKTLEKALKMDVQSAEIHFFLGLGYMDLKKNSKAEKHFLKTLELKPEMADAHFYLGVIYEQMGRFDKAVPSFKKVIELEPKNSNALNYLGYSFADRDINLDEAGSLIEKAITLEPDNGAYLDSLGWIYFKKKDNVNARKYLEKAASKLKDPVIFEHLGELDETEGNIKSALTNFRKAQELEPKNKKIKKKISKLEKKK
jgi:tetratricopeptide (TPR) repeat protein